MKALISDIHGNLEALQAVLEDIARHGVNEIYCLGDLVGYGPNPRECVDLAMQWKVCLLGNFEQSIVAVSPDFGPTAVIATQSIRWTQRQLDRPIPNREAAERRWNFLKGLTRQHQEAEFLFVHGSPRNPLHEYVFPEDIYNARKMEQIFILIERCCFNGHTHVPGIFTENLQFQSPVEFDYVYRFDRRKTLCNVGSVGQPRDGDSRACYVLLDEDIVRFRRIDYDSETTIRKIHGGDDLDDFSGDRLSEGR